MTGPDGQPVEVESNDTVLVHGVDETGHYVGLVESAFAVAGSAPPEPQGVYVWVRGRWRKEFTLDVAKELRWRLIKEKRDVAEFSTFSWDGSTFDCTREAQSRIMGTVQMATLAIAASQPFEVTWTLADNSTRVLDAEEIISVGLTLGAHVTSIHATARSLRDTIEAATTYEQIVNVRWP